MSEPVKLCIVLEGGLVQAVISAGVPLEVMVIDYDTDGADPSELRNILQDDGSEEPAIVSNWGTFHPTASEMAFTARAFESAARFLNHYDCPDCGTSWQDESAHACDDRCPSCDASCSPSESEDILPGNAPCSASEQIPHYDKGEAPIASEAAPGAEIDAIAEPLAGMWRARLVTPNFTFEAFGIDIASARRALGRGLVRHAQQYGLDPGRWHDSADRTEIGFVRDSAAYCDGDLIRERGARD